MDIYLTPPRGRSKVFRKGEAAISGVEMYSQPAKHAGTRGSGAPPRKILKIDAKILQFRGIFTHYTT